MSRNCRVCSGTPEQICARGAELHRQLRASTDPHLLIHFEARWRETWVEPGPSEPVIVRDFVCWFCQLWVVRLRGLVMRWGLVERPAPALRSINSSLAVA